MKSNRSASCLRFLLVSFILWTVQPTGWFSTSQSFTDSSPAVNTFATVAMSNPNLMRRDQDCYSQFIRPDNETFIKHVALRFPKDKILIVVIVTGTGKSGDAIGNHHAVIAKAVATMLHRRDQFVTIIELEKAVFVAQSEADILPRSDVIIFMTVHRRENELDVTSGTATMDALKKQQEKGTVIFPSLGNVASIEIKSLYMAFHEKKHRLDSSTLDSSVDGAQPSEGLFLTHFLINRTDDFTALKVREELARKGMYDASRSSQAAVVVKAFPSAEGRDVKTFTCCATAPADIHSYLTSLFNGDSSLLGAIVQVHDPSLCGDHDTSTAENLEGELSCYFRFVIDKDGMARVEVHSVTIHAPLDRATSTLATQVLFEKYADGRTWKNEAWMAAKGFSDDKLDDIIQWVMRHVMYQIEHYGFTFWGRFDFFESGSGNNRRFVMNEITLVNPGFFFMGNGFDTLARQELIQSLMHFVAYMIGRVESIEPTLRYPRDKPTGGTQSARPDGRQRMMGGA